MEGRGIIPFPASPQGVGRQVLADPVDAVDKLPLGDPPQLVKGYIPPAQGEGFGQRPLLAKLRRRAAKLLGNHRGGDIPAQPVDAGHMEIIVAGHGAAGAG